MLLGWFDSREATVVGSSLAEQFINGDRTVERQQKKSKLRQAADPMRQLLQSAEREIRPLRLNFYKRAKLANAFRWRLLEGGITKRAAEQATRSLVMHLSLSEATAVPAAAPSTENAATAGRADAEQLRITAEGLMSRSAYAEAVDVYQDLIRLQPRDGVTLNNLAGALCNLGRYQEAQPHLRRAIALAPRYPDPYNNLGAALRSTGHPAAAEPLIRRALKLKPSYVEARTNLGYCLLALGSAAAAKVHFERALKMVPRFPAALLGMGHIAVSQGCFVDAEASYRQALEGQPDLPAAWAALVKLRKMTPSDRPWLDRARAIAARRITPPEQVNLHFAMGKYFDDVGDFEHAFQSYKFANDTRKTFHETYSRDAYGSFIDDLIRAYGQERSWAGIGSSPSTKPVFVVGMMRSGTTLVEQIIASHPSARGAGELDFWANVVVRHEQKLRRGVIAEKDKKKLAAAYLQVLQRDAGDAKRIVDKTPGNSHYLGLIHSIFPQARIIYLRRHPVDTCLSCYFQEFTQGRSFTMDLSDLAHYYRQHHRLMTHWRAVMPPGAILDVPYADLVADQDTWTRRILQFIGLDWDERCLNFHDTNRTVATASAWQVRQKLYKTSVDRWRHYERFIAPLLELQELAW